MEIIKADTIEQYNRFFGFQTRHPLVSVAHFDRADSQEAYRMTFGFYALFLKRRKHETGRGYVGFPVPAAFPPLFQERSRVYPGGIPDKELKHCGLML